ncbi:TIGR03619 family F420-dependent LLM class oxidoreductase [Gordonia liuliyuniae]|uniref:TIGR03619 family F420-dependent LLM class oxidoreductase n=1 Tax=Gordonia liuliyuniae TaxID=2911517 RepID=A0ABS9IP50_9ACTN|nr:TIGR03619 family F420-dependent LLM class oxidoreductase [Gordonia liuliyuniae]MCF8587322.1 TIGR03619 family F420-dependent LLM class oxidoreductase [Gordonia liuliyuniae]
MKFTVEYPVGGPDFDPLLLSRGGVRRVVTQADEAGFAALALTEHPAPSLRWLQAGGHETLDLTTALAFFAAATERIGLMTYLLVLPYHNPFAAAKALTTVDLLSDGRLTVVAGTGYLKSEYRTLGIDFEARNERFDESLHVMKGLWSAGAPYNFEGVHFAGRDVASLPKPVTAGGPPIVIGGNSALSRRRAAAHHGWSPLIVSEEVAATTRMPMLTIAMLKEQIATLREASPDAFVQVQTPQSDYLRGPMGVDEHRAHLHELEAAGVDSFVVQLPVTSIAAAVDGLAAYAAEFLAPIS